MLQFQYMAPWIPTFNSCIASELAARNNKPPFITFQLATVDHDGRPHNRTLVFRGFLFDDRSTNILTFTTDKRMAKYQELKENDSYEAVFYFPMINKQFRFSGKARLIDSEHQPVIELSGIGPKSVNNSRKTQSYGSDSDDSSDDEGLTLATSNAGSQSSASRGLSSAPQSVPVSSCLLSPSFLTSVRSSTDQSYTCLADLGASAALQGPTDEEWASEIERHWSQLSKALKKSFRKPPPKVLRDDANQKLIDSIGRGVDGKKDEDGLKNFAVVAMFVDQVDFLELEKDRRYIYEIDSYHQWKELEVCP